MPNGSPFFVKPAQLDISPVLSGLGAITERARQDRKQEELERGLFDAYQSEDPDVVAAFVARNPQASGALDAVMGFRDEVTRKNQIDSMRDILKNPEPGNVERVLRERIDLVTQRGGDPTETIQALESFKVDPQGFIRKTELGYAEKASPQEWKAYRELVGEKEKPKIGTYNPRDYTVESFSQFMKTNDPSVLERYTEKTIDVGGVPHILDTATNQYKPIKTAGEIGTDKAEIETIVTTARETAKKDVEKKVTQEGQKTKLNQADEIYQELKKADLDKIYGFGESLYPDFLRSEEGVTLQAKRDQLIGMLKLAGRGELKGQGPITEGEQAIVAEAATILTNPNISPEAARKALDNAMEILYRNAGMEFAPANGTGEQPAAPIPQTNEQGWPLMTDAQGNKAYVGPQGQIQEVK